MQERRELQKKMFGSLRPIPREEYMKIYQSTGNGHDTAHLGENFRFKNIKSFVSSAAGIDVDGRREMIKHMIPCLEKSIKRFIAFAKALPGFKDIPIEDQIALIKGW